MIDRTPKPCLHKVANHQHGTYACHVLDKCRCLPCCYARSQYDLQRAKNTAYGRSNLVDAGPVRDHVKALMAAGVGIKRIVALSGVSHGGLWKLIYGKNGKPPSVRVTRSTADRILALDPGDLANAADRAYVASVGTRRRLRALACLGWSIARIAAAGDLDRQALDQAMAGKDVTATTARAVAALYDRLWNRPPPANNQRERISVSRTRNRAKAAGWAGPLAWDDDTIDDPAARSNRGHTIDGTAFDEIAVQRAMHGDAVGLRPVERAEVVHRLTAQGLSAAQIAARVRIDKDSVQRIRDQRRRADGAA